MTRLGDLVFYADYISLTFAMFRLAMSSLWVWRMRLDSPLWMRRGRENGQTSHLGFAVRRKLNH